MLAGFIPLLILLAGYIYFDPFKVLGHYSSYSNPTVTPNRDYISTEMFIRNNPAYHYNSFVFGSSRTLAFKPAEWIQYLPADARPFMFDAFGENVYGIYTKLRYLDSMQVPVKNAIILLCRNISFKKRPSSRLHLFIKDPRTSDETKTSFHLTFFKAYLNPIFLYQFYAYKLFGRKPFIPGYIEDRRMDFDTITNAMSFNNLEKEAAENPAVYYGRQQKEFYKRSGETTSAMQQITGDQLIWLKGIKQILEKQHSNYKIVLSPLYEQVKFNDADMLLLRQLFGNNVYDFSGKNQFTDAITNYYESRHFRPKVGDAILKIIYAAQP